MMDGVTLLLMVKFLYCWVDLFVVVVVCVVVIGARVVGDANRWGNIPAIRLSIGLKARTGICGGVNWISLVPSVVLSSAWSWLVVGVTNGITLCCCGGGVVASLLVLIQFSIKFVAVFF